MIGKALGLWNFICSRTVKTIPDTDFGPGHLSLCKCDDRLPEPRVWENYVNKQVNTPAESQSLMVWIPSVCAAWPQSRVKILRIFSVLIILDEVS